MIKNISFWIFTLLVTGILIVLAISFFDETLLNNCFNITYAEKHYDAETSVNIIKFANENVKVIWIISAFLPQIIYNIFATCEDIEGFEFVVSPIIAVMGIILSIVLFNLIACFISFVWILIIIAVVGLIFLLKLIFD